jgi:hypothetical protein
LAADAAAMAAPGAGVSGRGAGGRPVRLALANFPAQAQIVAEAFEQADTELAFADPVQVADRTPSPAFAAAFDAPAPAIQSTVSAAPKIDYVSNPVVQQLPAGRARRAPATPAAPQIAGATPQRRMAGAAVATPVAAPAPVVSDKGAATHLVQLGSYSSKAKALRGWTVLQGKFPQLKNHEPVITEAVVGGRTFWRVAANGFGASSAKAMCGTVKSAGRDRFAYAAAMPPAGAVKRDVKLASRSR